MDLGDRRPTAVIGNPPFDLDVVDAIFDRCFDLLPYGGRVGFIMPAYAFQTASRVVKYARRWSFEQDMIPRNLFKEMQKPLCFAVLTKDSGGRMRGFSLYRELHDVNSMKSWVVDELSAGRSPWKTVVARAIEGLGGRAKLQDIYAVVAPRRPTGNNWWQAKIRQTLRRSGAFTRVGESEYSLARDDMRVAA
jgi:site-specific DNA-methyltransferase (adenine-specific)